MATARSRGKDPRRPAAGPRPRKRLGQHFLHDPHVLGRITAALQPLPGQHFVEIGPGTGALTRLLLPAVGRMDAVELDRELIPLLHECVAGLGELRVHHADAVKFDYCALAAPGSGLRIVGNLPYNISTPLLFRLMEQLTCIADMHFMVQKEVALRLAAGPGGRSYGRLGIMIQYKCAVEKLFDVGAGAFAPAPRVASAFVRLSPRPAPLLHVRDEAVFKQVVTRAFSQRRKTLRNALRGLLSEDQIAAQGLDPAARPETVSIESFARLSDCLQ